MSFVTHLEAAIDGTILPHEALQSVHAGRPLWVRYDLDAVGAALNKQELAGREPTMWRYRELLPVSDETKIASLGEGMSPLLRCARLGSALGLSDLWVKDESQLPTGSFKSRGLSVAISRANELGVQRVAIPTAGNAGGAMAAYAARVGMEAFVFMPADTPIVNQYEAAYYGAHAFLVDGLITDCGAIVREGTPHMDWFDLSTLKEPYRIEGKKTMGLELAEQFSWSLPDVITYPTGGGTGLIGMWKAFAELAALGWLIDDRRPRMVSCQAAGCAPISTAWQKGERFADPFPAPATSASGLRVPAAVGDFMIIDAINESGGQARACPEDSLLYWARRGSELEGIAFAPEAGACLGVLEMLVSEKVVDPEERVVVFNTGAAQKYIEVIGGSALPRLSPPVDWTALST
ncbi:MAG: threonine synthase [Candidatus Palauibacterales bacterium]|nr:threonine synthase [Candidatus Palauibacterales bacterium]MDP2483411.1 threonine synthase [Candidatus Palauibacterales bacterium]